jgi:hypothetical protein
MTLLQSASIVSKLTASEEQKLKSLSKDQATRQMLQWLNDEKHALGKEFKTNKLWQYDTRYGMSGRAAALLDAISGQQ